jgi:hypothetical protein
MDGGAQENNSELLARPVSLLRAFFLSTTVVTAAMGADAVVATLGVAWYWYCGIDVTTMEGAEVRY